MTPLSIVQRDEIAKNILMCALSGGRVQERDRIKSLLSVILTNGRDSDSNEELSSITDSVSSVSVSDTSSQLWGANGLFYTMQQNF